MAYFLEYEARETVLHKGLHPLTKLVAMACITITLSFWWDWRYLFVFLLLAGVLVYISKVPKAWFSVILGVMIGSIYPFMVSAIGQTNPDIYKVLDRQWATTPILTRRVPIVGTLGLTYGGLWWLAATEIRMFLMAAYVFTFIYTTSLSEVTDTLLGLRVPQPIVFVVSLAYKLIPYLSRVISGIVNAQRLRGWSMSIRNPVKMFRRALPLLKPLMRQVAILTEHLTVAAQARAFGSGKVTPTQGISLSCIDLVVIVAAVALFLASAVGSIFYSVGQI